MKKKVYDYLGKEFGSITEMCRYWGITIDNYYARKKKGWTLEEILSKKDCSTNIKCIDHLGNKYDSVEALCKTWNISRARYEHRIKAGYSIKDALTMDNKVGIKCQDHLGNNYPSIIDMCKSWGVTRSKFEHRLKMGLSVEEALTKGDLTNCKPSRDHLGNIYSSFTEMCKAYGVDRTTVTGRLERQWTIEEALTGKREKIIPKSVPCKDHLGNRYSTYAEMCRTYELSYSLFKRRRNLGWTLEETLTGKIYPIKPNSKSCKDHLGNEFRSIKDMCTFWGITPDLHKGRLRDN